MPHSSKNPQLVQNCQLTAPDLPSLSAYWLPYADTLNQPKAREAVLRSLLLRPEVKAIYLNAIAAEGCTFDRSDTIKELGDFNPHGDIFHKFEQLRQATGREDVKAVAWIEAWGYTLQNTPLAKFAKERGFVLTPPLKDGIVFFDPLNLHYFERMKQAVNELAKRPEISAIALDHHFGLLDKIETIDGKAKVRFLGMMIRLHPKAPTRINPQTQRREVDPQWMRDQVTHQLKSISRIVHQYGKKLILSTQPFEVARIQHHQEVEQWLQEGWIDGLDIQIHRGTTETFEKTLSKEVVHKLQKAEPDSGLAKLNRNIPLSISLVSSVDGEDLSIEQKKTQVELIRRSGYEPIAFDYQKFHAPDAKFVQQVAQTLLARSPQQSEVPKSFSIDNKIYYILEQKNETTGCRELMVTVLEKGQRHYEIVFKAIKKRPQQYEVSLNAVTASDLLSFERLVQNRSQGHQSLPDQSPQRVNPQSQQAIKRNLPLSEIANLSPEEIAKLPLGQLLRANRAVQDLKTTLPTYRLLRQKSELTHQLATLMQECQELEIDFQEQTETLNLLTERGEYSLFNPFGVKHDVLQEGNRQWTHIWTRRQMLHQQIQDIQTKLDAAELEEADLHSRSQEPYHRTIALLSEKLRQPIVRRQLRRAQELSRSLQPWEATAALSQVPDDGLQTQEALPEYLQVNLISDEALKRGMSLDFSQQ